MRSKVLFLLVIAGLMLLNPLLADEATDDLYRKGLREYHLGHYDEAAKAFEAYLENEPSAKSVLKLLDESSTRPLVEMYHNDKLRGVAARILRIPSEEIRKIKTDDERTKELVKELLGSQFNTTEDSRKRIRDAQEKLIVIGAPAIPYMIDYLGVKNAETMRSTIHVTINGIGDEAGLPLIQGLSHTNAMVRSNVASLLGLIDDTRAIPALKALHENDENKIVLENCEKALFRLTKKMVTDLPEARKLFLQQADDYLHRDPRVMRLFEDDQYFLFSWNNEKTIIRRTDTIRRYIWHLEMAEECCYRALSTPGITPDRDVYPLMANVYYNQLDIVDGLIKQRIARGVNDGNHEKEMADFKAHRQELRKAIAFGPVFGSDSLHEALQLASIDRNAYVVEMINDALRRINADIQHTQFLLPVDATKISGLNAALAKERAEALAKLAQSEQNAAEEASLKTKAIEELMLLKDEAEKELNELRLASAEEKALRVKALEALSKLEAETASEKLDKKQALEALAQLEAKTAEERAAKEKALAALKKLENSQDDKEVTKEKKAREFKLKLTSINNQVNELKALDEDKYKALPDVDSEPEKVNNLDQQLNDLLTSTNKKIKALKFEAFSADADDDIDTVAIAGKIKVLQIETRKMKSIKKNLIKELIEFSQDVGKGK